MEKLLRGDLLAGDRQRMHFLRGKPALNYLAVEDLLPRSFLPAYP